MLKDTSPVMQQKKSEKHSAQGVSIQALSRAVVMVGESSQSSLSWPIGNLRGQLEIQLS